MLRNILSGWQRFAFSKQPWSQSRAGHGCLWPASSGLWLKSMDKLKQKNAQNLAILLVTFSGWWKRDPFKGLRDLQLGDQKVTLNHLEVMKMMNSLNDFTGYTQSKMCWCRVLWSVFHVLRSLRIGSLWCKAFHRPMRMCSPDNANTLWSTRGLKFFDAITFHSKALIWFD